MISVYPSVSVVYCFGFRIVLFSKRPSRTYSASRGLHEITFVLKTDYITEQKWEDIFTIWYVLIDDAYQQLVRDLGQRLRERGPEPAFSDSEVITVGLIIETFFSIRLINRYSSA